MKVREWDRENPGKSFTMVWAGDTKGGFGKKGWSVYGSREVTGELEVIEVEENEKMAFAVLHVWNYSWGNPGQRN